MRSSVAVLVCLSLVGAQVGFAQTPTVPAKYKLTIVEGASTSKRVKNGRVSSQAVVKVTDQNDVPVAGVAVFFAIPQGSAGGATFAGGLTSMSTTNSAGIASSGSFTAAPQSSLGINASASGPGGVVSTVVPVATSTLAAAAGISTGLLIGIIAGVSAAVATGVAIGVTRGGGSPTGTIGAVGGPTFGAP